MLGKLFGAFLGFTLGGPIGSLIGFGFGALFDHTDVKKQTYTYRGRTYHATEGDFAISLLVLSAAMMRADNRILKQELDFIKDFFKAEFGVEKTKEYMLQLKELLKKDIPLKEVCLQIKSNMSLPARLQLLDFLCGIAAADDSIDDNEVQLVNRIGLLLGIRRNDIESIKIIRWKHLYNAYSQKQQQSYGRERTYQSTARQTGPSQLDYKVLEIEVNASDEEGKKAYRRLARKYHPDKVAHLGEEVQEAAKRKFQGLNESYERIKKSRGMN